MKTDNLDALWQSQNDNIDISDANRVINKAKKQRNGQYITIAVMTITLFILIVYTFYFSFNEWNNFNLGLMLMISSLAIRIILEIYSVYKKENQLIAMHHKSYLNYLKKYYKTRMIIHYLVTPLCITSYSIGFYLLLPYFKNYLSEGFYNYILISGVLVIFFIVAIITNSTLKERRFLKQLR